MNPLPRRRLALLAGFALIVLGLPALPVAPAANYGYGTTVAKYDNDYTPEPKAVASSAVCYRDLDSSGTYNSGEPLYVDVNAATCSGKKVEMDDVRLTPVDSYKSGTQVKEADTDWSMPYLGPVNDDLLYVDFSGDNKFGAKDALYLDLMGVGNARADVGDLRLIAYKDYPAGTFVRAGDLDTGTGLAELKSGGLDLGDTSVLYKAGSTYYINVDGGTIGSADLFIEEGDVRLLEKTPNAGFGAYTDIVVEILAASPAHPLPGQTIYVSVEATNDGKSPTAGLLATNVNDVTVDARGTPWLDAGQSATLVVPVMAPSKAGPFKVDVNGEVLDLAVDEGPIDVDAARLDDLTERVKALEKVSGNVGIQEHEAEQPAGRSPGPPSLLVVFAIVGVALALVWARRPT